MLLPSDVARLVLGYLQQEKLLATCQTFILESSDLKEYAEHCTGEGFVPACLLSLFGKNLVTILNEYIAMKAKETSNDVPAITASLWKKLDYTLSQIRSMENSRGFSTHQRSRTRSTIADMKKQKCLQSASNSGSLSVTHQPVHLNSTPITATQVILKPIIIPNLPQTRSSMAPAHLTQIQENHINRNSLISVPVLQERKLHSSMMSPGKHKSDSQKKKSTVSVVPQSSSSCSQNSLAVEEESSSMEEESETQELIDGSLPQMIIENAREKILSNKCLQEKLAENINKFLGSDGNVVQNIKQVDSGPAVQESSIDELFGLQQGEIHMTEEAIQEILEQTESDPAFHGVFDMFDFGKTKSCRNQNGSVENALLVEQQDLEEIESYIATNEIGDTSQETLSYTSDNSKESDCVLTTDCHDSDGNSDEHLKLQNIMAGPFPTDSKVRSESNLVDSEGGNQRTHLKTGLTSEQNPISDSEVNEDSVGSSNKPKTTTRDCRTDKDILCQDVQNLPGLPYDQLDMAHNSLTGRDECCLLPSQMLSEKTNIRLGQREEIYKKTNVAISSHSADSGENLEPITEALPVFPIVGQQNNSQNYFNCQEQDKLESASSTTTMAEACDPEAIQIQLEVVDTSHSPHSDDQSTLSKSISKDSNQKSQSSEITQIEIQEPSSSTRGDAESLFMSSENERHSETSENNPTICHSPPELLGKSNPETTVSASSQASDVDSSNIVSLKIIISEDPFVSSDTELNNAISSITEDDLPTIILSSPAKSPSKVVGPSRPLTSEAERTQDSASGEQNLLVLRPQEPVVSTVNVQTEECAVLSIAGTSNVAKDGGVLQLMPSTSASFGNPNSIYLATCVTEPTALNTNVTPSSVVMLPGGSASHASQVPAPQQLRTPPRSSSLFAMNPPMSPNFSQGSAIIIASPVQPVLQGMVGMIPLSIMGQSGNTFSDPSLQILSMPIQTSLGSGGAPKLPLPPKSQRIPRSKPNAGKQLPNGSESVNRSGSRMQRTGNSDKNGCVDLKKKEGTAAEATTLSSKSNENHRRVLCFDSSTLSTPGESIPASEKEMNEKPLPSKGSPSPVSSAAKVQPKKERERTLPRILCKPNISGKNLVAKEQSGRKNSGLGMASDALRKQTANKENEIERSTDKALNIEAANLPNSQQNTSLHSEKNSSTAEELTKKQGLQSNANSKNAGAMPSKESKKDQTKSSNQTHCLANPLTKQAAEMLHDIQKQSPSSKLAENGDLPVPRTPSVTGDRHTDDAFDIIRTPTCRRYSEDSTTPKVMIPPVTPDLPACSPASETSSENSVSMAAHTLMILSRAAIARTSTTIPLKDNTQQLRSLRSAAKKRKQEDVVECEKNSRTASKKDLQNFTIPVKKKKVKQKKLPISFPAGMDVDKFLLSLRYDE